MERKVLKLHKTNKVNDIVKKQLDVDKVRFVAILLEKTT